MIHFCGGDDFEKQVNIEYKKKDIVVSARKESASIIRKMENNTKTVGVKFTVSPVLLSSFLSENDSKVYIYDNKMFFIMPNFTHVIGM